MKDLLVNSNGDLVLSSGDFQYVKDANLMRQKAQLILSTNKSEWNLNPDEGIDFFAILTKNPNYDQILDTVLDGLHQVDEDIQIDSYDFKLVNRRLTMNFTASLPSGQFASFTLGEVQGDYDPNNWLIRALADLVDVEGDC